MKNSNKLFLAIITSTAFNFTIATEIPQSDTDILYNQPPNSSTVPRDTIPLSSIMTRLRQHGYSPEGNAELENGRWIIKAEKESQQYILAVDPTSGDVISEMPDSN